MGVIKRKTTLTRKERQWRKWYPVTIALTTNFTYHKPGDGGPKAVDHTKAKEKTRGLRQYAAGIVARYEELCFDPEEHMDVLFSDFTNEDGTAGVTLLLNFDMHCKRIFEWFGLTKKHLTIDGSPNFKMWKKLIKAFECNGVFHVDDIGLYHNMQDYFNEIDYDDYESHDNLIEANVKRMFGLLKKNLFVGSKSDLK